MRGSLDRLRRRAIYVACRALSRESFRHGPVRIVVHHGVFNPTLFRSSLLFARRVLDWAPAAATEALELGSGCGLVSVSLAARGHRVTAIDRDGAAAANVRANAVANRVAVRVVVSDWDAALASSARFDYVVCNPPFSPELPPALADALFSGGDVGPLAEAIRTVGRRLSPEGRAVILTSERSGRAQVLDLFRGAGLAVAASESRVRWMERFHLDLLTRCQSGS